MVNHETNTGKKNRNIPEQLSLFEEKAVQNIEEKVIIQRDEEEGEYSFLQPLIRDFDCLCNYLRRHKVHLTKKKEVISRTFLPEINQQMSVKNENATNNKEQEFYPYIHLLFTLAVNGKLFHKQDGAKGRLYIEPAEKLDQYFDLTGLEKYYFLLETLWVDTNWAYVMKRGYNRAGHLLQDLLCMVSEEMKSGDSFLITSGDLGPFIDYFSWFGFWEEADEEEFGDQDHVISGLTKTRLKITDQGCSLARILLVDRNLQLWNIHERKLNGELNPIPGSPADFMALVLNDEETEEVIENMSKRDQSSQHFCEPFMKLYPKGSLTKSLPRSREKFKQGLYTFKVSLSKSIWRELSFSANHTMADLHDLILQSFSFDDDHLYAFFMDGQPWSQDSIMSPDAMDRISADTVKIGDLNLEEKQRFVYLYDFGDEYLFDVIVTDINEQDPTLMRPYIKSTHGSAPEQYEDF